MKYSIAILLFFVILVTFVALPASIVRATVQEEIALRNKQIAEIQKQIDAFQSQILETSGKAKTLSTEITRLNALIAKIQLEVQSLTISISQTDSDIGQTQKNILTTEQEIDVHKKALGQALLSLHRNDQRNLTAVLLRNKNLSDFFSTIKSIDDVQKNITVNIVAMKSLKGQLEDKQSNLEDKKNELQQLKALQLAQRQTLDQNKGSKDQLLKATKGEEAKYQSLLKNSQQQLQIIREQITYLQQNGVSVQDAITYGKLAAIKTGVRPAFLIAILEVESRLGQNVGTGNWNDDLYQCYIRLGDFYPAKKAYYLQRAESEKKAFFEIVTPLGLDPAKVKVSKEPSYGCGGALGPAQFLPTTWLSYVEQVRANTGHQNPDPWNIEDAFMAAGIKLSKGGAALGTRDGEIRAAKAYISGNAACTSSICNYYANLALDKAAIIEQNL